MIHFLVIMLKQKLDIIIWECIKSLKAFSDVLVIDLNSSDSMKFIANFVDIGFI